MRAGRKTTTRLISESHGIHSWKHGSPDYFSYTFWKSWSSRHVLKRNCRCYRHYLNECRKVLPGLTPSYWYPVPFNLDCVEMRFLIYNTAWLLHSFRWCPNTLTARLQLNAGSSLWCWKLREACLCTTTYLCVTLDYDYCCEFYHYYLVDHDEDAHSFKH